MKQPKSVERFTILILVLALAAMAGCASTRDALGLAGKGDVAALRGEVTELRTEVAKKADKAEVAAVAQKGEHLEKKLSTVTVDVGIHGQHIGKLEQRANETDQAIAAVRKDLGSVTVRVGAVEAAQAKFRADLTTIEKQVVGVRTVSRGTVERVGILEDDRGYDQDRRAFRIGPFPDCKADEKGEEVTAGFEITAGIKTNLDEAAAIITKESKAVKLISGFADVRPFVDKKTGKRLEKSDELNSKCSAKRAEAVAEYLKKALDAKYIAQDLKVGGRGTSTRFGPVDMNRRAMIYAEAQ